MLLSSLPLGSLLGLALLSRSNASPHPAVRPGPGGKRSPFIGPPMTAVIEVNPRQGPPPKASGGKVANLAEAVNATQQRIKRSDGQTLDLYIPANGADTAITFQLQQERCDTTPLYWYYTTTNPVLSTNVKYGDAVSDLAAAQANPENIRAALKAYLAQVSWGYRNGMNIIFGVGASLAPGISNNVLAKSPGNDFFSMVLRIFGYDGVQGFSYSVAATRASAEGTSISNLAIATASFLFIGEALNSMIAYVNNEASELDWVKAAVFWAGAESIRNLFDVAVSTIRTPQPGSTAPLVEPLEQPAESELAGAIQNLREGTLGAVDSQFLSVKTMNDYIADTSSPWCPK